MHLPCRFRISFFFGHFSSSSISKSKSKYVLSMVSLQFIPLGHIITPVLGLSTISVVESLIISVELLSALISVSVSVFVPLSIPIGRAIVSTNRQSETITTDFTIIAVNFRWFNTTTGLQKWTFKIEIVIKCLFTTEWLIIEKCLLLRFISI